jgi:DNA polymerase-3 subunit beta
MRTVATDGHRLALQEASSDALGGVDLRVILPRKAVLELHRLLSDSDGIVRVECSSNHIRFEIGDSVFTSKLIDGKFPDYERVIPARGDNRLEVDRSILRQALMRASILSNEKYRGVRFEFKNGVLHLIANNPEQEEAEEEIEADYVGEEMTVGFNVGYLLDVLNVIESPTVKLSLTDANSSCLIENDSSESGRYVIMPMRL